MPPLLSIFEDVGIKFCNFLYTFGHNQLIQKLFCHERVACKLQLIGFDKSIDICSEESLRAFTILPFDFERANKIVKKIK